MELEQLARVMGVRVVVGTLPNDWQGAYHHATRTITMAPGLREADRQKYDCVLAHELGHAHYGHTAVNRRSTRAEILADRFAARLLIPCEKWVAAHAAVGPNERLLAHRLGVMRWVVRSYMDLMDPPELMTGPIVIRRSSDVAS
jgi:Zn-dependent peptidase ImmA (M78 family)